MNDFQVAEHFNLREFQCKGEKCCGNTVKIDSRLVSMLEALRRELGVPFVITSAFRCKEHNKRVGGAKGSYHLQGLAVDIACPKGYKVVEFAQICLDAGFTGVGAYPKQNFVHVDIRPGPQVRFQ